MMGLFLGDYSKVKNDYHSISSHGTTFNEHQRVSILPYSCCSVLCSSDFHLNPACQGSRWSCAINDQNDTGIYHMLYCFYAQRINKTHVPEKGGNFFSFAPICCLPLSLFPLLIPISPFTFYPSISYSSFSAFL